METIWFIAPTVALCIQQCDNLRSQIPRSVQIERVTGADHVDTWSTRAWGGLLKSARIVVSTPQVLLDALSHGFVKMDMFSLIVFDEGELAVVSRVA